LTQERKIGGLITVLYVLSSGERRGEKRVKLLRNEPPSSIAPDGLKQTPNQASFFTTIEGRISGNWRTGG